MKTSIVLIFPAKDASIYSEFPTKASGLDEILEVGKTDHGTDSVRSLIHFDLAPFSQSVAAGQFPSTTEFDLVLRIASAEKLIPGQQIYLYPISKSWDEGAGYFYQSQVYESYGTTWRSNRSGSSWLASGSDFLTSTFTSASMSNPVQDLVINVSTMVRNWLSGTITNNGVLLMFTASNESDVGNEGIVRFFSKDSHTVHRPTLVAKYDSSIYITGSTTASTNIEDVKIQASDLLTDYLTGEIPRVYLSVRPLYPTKTFADTLNIFNGTKYYLPTSSYFSLVDARSNTEIIPFDQYSKININGSGSYIEFSTEALYPLRYYQLRYRIERNGRVDIFTDKRLFTIRQV